MNDLEAYAAAQRRIHQVVSHELMSVLGRTHPPSPTTPFADAGLDSIMALTLRDRLERALGLSLPPTVVFEHPTLRALTRHLLARASEQASHEPDRP